jgi:hypothetical protein
VVGVSSILNWRSGVAVSAARPLVSRFIAGAGSVVAEEFATATLLAFLALHFSMYMIPL